VKHYVIEYKRCTDREPEPEWREVFGPQFADRDDAEREFDRLNDLHGHDTYHQLVEVKRKVLKSA
jgi:hypothetical protein